MAEAGLAAQRSQHWLSPGDAGEFAPWIDDPSRHFLRDLTVKLLIGAGAVVALACAAGA